MAMNRWSMQRSATTSLIGSNRGTGYSQRKVEREIVGFGVVNIWITGTNRKRGSDRRVLDVDWQKSGSWPTAAERMLSMKTAYRHYGR